MEINLKNSLIKLVRVLPKQSLFKIKFQSGGFIMEKNIVGGECLSFASDIPVDNILLIECLHAFENKHPIVKP